MIPPASPVFRKLLNPENVTAPAEAAKPPKGWQCPKCNNVYGPHVNACENCNEAPKV